MKSLKESLNSISFVSFKPRGIIGTSTWFLVFNKLLIWLEMWKTVIQIAIIIIISHPQHCHLRIVLHLIELNGAVELCELLLQQLQVGVHEAQLQRHRLLHLLVCRSPANFDSSFIPLSKAAGQSHQHNYLVCKSLCRKWRCNNDNRRLPLTFSLKSNNIFRYDLQDSLKYQFVLKQQQQQQQQQQLPQQQQQQQHQE